MVQNPYNIIEGYHKVAHLSEIHSRWPKNAQMSAHINIRRMAIVKPYLCHPFRESATIRTASSMSFLVTSRWVTALIPPPTAPILKPLA